MARNAEWERVLALAEAEADFAETLLDLPDVPPADALAPLLMQLPGTPELPPPSDMPPIPPELRDRVVALRDRIDELHRLLTAAANATPWQLMAASPATPPVTPRFLDRRV